MQKCASNTEKLVILDLQDYGFADELGKLSDCSTKWTGVQSLRLTERTEKWKVFLPRLKEMVPKVNFKKSIFNMIEQILNYIIKQNIIQNLHDV